MVENDLGYFEYENNRFSYREVAWSEAKEAQANLAANNPNIQGDFDLDLLPGILELAKLEEGYDELMLSPLEDLLGAKKIEEVEEEETPEPPANPISKPGDIYQLISGDITHEIMCADSTVIDPNYEFLTIDSINKIDLVLTDPPYGVDITKATESKGGVNPKGKYAEIAGDKDTNTAREFYHTCQALEIPKLIFWGGNYFADFLPPSRGWICWHKHSAEGLTFAQGELAWTNIDTNLRVYNQTWSGGNRQGDKTIELKDRVHPTQKPVTMQAQIIEDFAPEAKTVLDGFLGSGSLLIACQVTNRTCIGFEIMPAYIDVSIKRWINYMQKKNLPIEIRRNGEVISLTTFA